MVQHWFHLTWPWASFPFYPFIPLQRAGVMLRHSGHFHLLSYCTPHVSLKKPLRRSEEMEAEKTSRNSDLCQVAKTLSFLSETKHKTWECPAMRIQAQNSHELLFSLSQDSAHINAYSVLELGKKFILLLCSFETLIMELVILNTSLRLCFLNLLSYCFSVNIFLVLWWSFVCLEFHTEMSC